MVSVHGTIITKIILIQCVSSKIEYNRTIANFFVENPWRFLDVYVVR